MYIYKEPSNKVIILQGSVESSGKLTLDPIWFDPWASLIYSLYLANWLSYKLDYLNVLGILYQRNVKPK